MQEEYSGAIYIIGPKDKDNYEQTLPLLKQKFNKLVVIGNGEDDLLDDNGNGPLQDIYSLEQDHPELFDGRKILVYIEYHGTEDNGQHLSLVRKSGDPIQSKAIFDLLSQNIETPMDIIFVPCHGKASLPDINELPIDSRVIIFSDSDKATFSNFPMEALKRLDRDEFSFDGFYNNALKYVFSANDSPSMSIIGKETIDPLILSNFYLGKSISKSSKEYIHNHFGQDICNNDTSCHDKIDFLMVKIEQNSSIRDFIGNERQLSLKMLQELSDLEQEYQITFNTLHEQKIIYNHKESEHCYIEILDLKNKTDQLFLNNQIGLELDLSNNEWYEIDYDYVREEDILFFEGLFPIGLYKMNLYNGYKENNAFPRPEAEDYGLVLGIIKDIHLSLSELDQ